MTVSRNDLSTARVSLNWQVRERHSATMSLLRLLEMVDMNEESWTNEDGEPRFSTVEEAFEWVSGQPGPMDDYSFGEALYEMSGSNTWTDGEVDSFDTDVDLLPAGDEAVPA